MPKQITLVGTSFGFDINSGSLDVYHTSTGSQDNFLTGSLSTSSFDSPGVIVTIPDTATQIIIACNTGSCSGSSQSFNVAYSPAYRFFDFFTAGTGTGSIEAITPTSAGPSQTSITNYTVNFNTNPVVVISSSFTPSGNKFEGWYQSSNTSSTQWTASAVLTMGLNDFTASNPTHAQDDFYAIFTKI